MEVAETMNDFFCNIVKHLKINRQQDENFTYDFNKDHIANIIFNYKDNPSVTKIKETINTTNHFHFTPVSEEQISEEKKTLIRRKHQHLMAFPPKFLLKIMILFHHLLLRYITNLIQIYISQIPSN